MTATHQKDIDYGPTILTYYYPMCAETKRADDAVQLRMEAAGRRLSDRSCPGTSGYLRPDDRLDVMRWGHAMISPRPNFIWSGIREKAEKPYRNIHFAHTDLSGIALFEEAFYHGLRVAQEILVNNKPQRR